MGFDSSLTPRIFLDLDCTLSDTQKYYFGECHKLHPITGTSIESLIKEYHYVENVQEWSSDSTVMEWVEWFRHNNDEQENLPLLPDVKEGVARIDPKIKISYASGRPHEVYRGTKKWLEKHEFPEGPLFLRPKNIPGNRWREWKARFIDSIFPFNQGGVDDDSLLPQALQSLGYQGSVIIFGHSNHPLANDRYIPSLSWKDVPEKINRTFLRYSSSDDF